MTVSTAHVNCTDVAAAFPRSAQPSRVSVQPRLMDSTPYWILAAADGKLS